MVVVTKRYILNNIIMFNGAKDQAMHEAFFYFALVMNNFPINELINKVCAIPVRTAVL